MDAYKYTALKEGTGEIRLLTLLPDRFEKPIRISLEITILSDDEVPEFEALSYAWGNASDVRDIFIEANPPTRPELREREDTDGIEWRRLRVTKNLFEALKHLRLEGRPKIMWIDAICVDQQNLEERCHQILRMPDIYTLAAGVIAWLGPESDDSSVAMKTIENLGSRITVNWDLQTMVPAPEGDFNPDSEQSYHAVAPSAQVWIAIHHLLGRAWFERLWIIQEVSLAGKNTHVVCGSMKIWCEHFGNGIFYLMAWKDHNEPQVERLWDLVSDLLALCNQTSFRDLDRVLHETRQGRCSDQRDRIYAVLSLVPEYKRLGIRPDYTKSVTEVFQSVVLQQVKHRSQLDVLHFCSMDDRAMDLPTWVPDCYRVVGECYLDGIMSGEALLGLLPKGWMLIRKHYPEYHRKYWAFLDGNTGQIQVDDPRLGPLPAGWRLRTHTEKNALNWFGNDRTGEDAFFDPRVGLDMLKTRGVELQEFRLI
ncbi:MAG: hypothetical protein Q9221_007106 [Calogaya cf. arnoldii]